MPQPTASRHLAYLRRSGLVDARRDGAWMHYRISASLEPVVRAVVDAAVHALTHVPTTSRDRRQFAKTVGNPPPSSARAVAGPCCARK